MVVSDVATSRSHIEVARSLDGLQVAKVSTDLFLLLLFAEHGDRCNDTIAELWPPLRPGLHCLQYWEEPLCTRQKSQT